MSTIYGDQHVLLSKLLAMAGKSEDATLLIPDLQRPYVWLPAQVTYLVDSLLRGWPFGTLLTWKVKPDDPARHLARSFWRVVDRTGNGDGQPISMKNPPATFQMVLDGQQRVQSLLLALGGDGWGFQLLDRQWHEHLSGTKPRGPRGRPHWSLGCLCVNVLALRDAYKKTKSATSIDYTTILGWVVTDKATGQSKLEKPLSYKPVLPVASATAGQFVRLARLWELAPEQANLDPYAAEDIADKILTEHGVLDEGRDDQVRATAALLLALRDVKHTRVTYLELAEYEAALGSRDVYNDAVVNIFTRLNTAGRQLTREDITFAWLKIGWNTAGTQQRGAQVCIEDLAQDLKELSVPASVEDVIAAISFVWSVSFNSGKLLNNNDLMQGETIRPMAANVSDNWSLVVEAATRVCAHAWDRGLRFREHYQSINSLAYLWAWYFAALRWQKNRGLKELDKDSLAKSLIEGLDALMDRWLICSQWAGVWASGSAQNLAGYAARLAECAHALSDHSDPRGAVTALAKQLRSEIDDMERPAVDGLNRMNADDRQDVRSYYTALWLWNRLESNRWAKAQLALRQQGRRADTLHVDHIVACDLWQSKLDEAQVPADTETSEVLDSNALDGEVNALGNCMLLEKNFNISKSNRPLKTFLEDVHEFKQGKISIADWASALDLEMPQVDSADTPVETLRILFAKRSQRIRGDLEDFVFGTKARIDI